MINSIREFMYANVYNKNNFLIFKKKFQATIIMCDLRYSVTPPPPKILANICQHPNTKKRKFNLDAKQK